MMSSQSKYLISLIDDIMDLAKMDGQAFEIQESHFLLDELLKEIEEIFSMQIEGKGLKFITSCDFIGGKADLEVFSDRR